MSPSVSPNHPGSAPGPSPSPPPPQQGPSLMACGWDWSLVWCTLLCAFAASVARFPRLSAVLLRVAAAVTSTCVLRKLVTATQKGSGWALLACPTATSVDLCAALLAHTANCPTKSLWPALLLTQKLIEEVLAPFFLCLETDQQLDTVAQGESP
jgi:hypothetical protein